jgi:class 3 adenylate cyclase
LAAGSGGGGSAVTGPAGVITFLFTDLVGSTALIDRLGDDAADGVRRGHFELLRRAVTESGGREVKNLGDGLMVSFVSPVAALSCAVAMQRAVGGSGLELRVGLHAGEPTLEGDDYFGTPVVVAKRLCDLARGGQIVASELLAGFVGTRGGFRFRPLGKLALKGLSEPVAAVEVELGTVATDGVPTAQARPLPRVRPPRPRGPGLVGRDVEMAALESELAAAAAGELRCVLVTGDPGLGKSRLCAEVIARHDEIIALKARGHPMGETTAFGLWAEAIDAYLRHLEAGEVSAVCGGYLEDLASLLRSVAAVRGGPPSEPPSRQGLLEGITVVLDRLSRAAPVVLVLDDIHDADASSLDCVSYLAHNLAAAPILVVLAARPTELAAHPVANRILLSLQQDGLLSRLPIDGLRQERIADLAAAVIGHEAPPGLVVWLLDRSRGNPLFALGLLRALLDEGADLTAPRLRHIPEDLAERVRSLLATLDEPALSALELLSVIGRAAPIEDLESLLAKDPDQLAGILERLGRARTVVEDEDGRGLTYGISHPLIQETIYQSIGAARRRVLHREVGRSLLAAGRPAEAAPHFARSASAGDGEAIDALRLALQQAEDRRAYREALTMLSALVDLLPEGDERWLAVANVISGELEWAEQPDPSRADAELGIRALRAIDAVLGPDGDPLQRGMLKIRLSQLLSWGTGETAEGERVAREAEGLLADAGDTANALLARLENAWARGLGGDMMFLISEATAVVGEAEATRNPFLRILGVAAQAHASVWVGRFAEAELAGAKGIDLAQAGMRRPPTTFRTVMSLAAAFRGAGLEAKRIWEQAQAADPNYRAGPFVGVAVVAATFVGDLPSAVGLADDYLSSVGSNLTPRQSFGLGAAAYAAREMGRPEAARRYLDLSRESHARVEWLNEAAYDAGAAALLDADEGGDGAVESLAAAIARLEAMSFLPLAAVLLLDLAELASGTHDTRSEFATRRLNDIATVLKCDVYQAMARIASAYATPRTEHRASVAREAIALLDQLDLRLLRGRANDVLGRGLSPTDPDAAKQAFERAVTEFDSCGATLRRDRALAELDRI